MTDGIIQQVFKKHMDSIEYLDEVMVSNWLSLQQELIEKIKQEAYNPTCSLCDREIKVADLKELIGDNKE